MSIRDEGSQVGGCREIGVQWCLSGEEIEGLATGNLPTGQAARAIQHLICCQVCILKLKDAHHFVGDPREVRRLRSIRPPGTPDSSKM